MEEQSKSIEEKVKLGIKDPNSKIKTGLPTKKGNGDNNASDSDEDDENFNLSDIDDAEIENCMMSKEEIAIKSIIWTKMNKDWLEE